MVASSLVYDPSLGTSQGPSSTVSAGSIHHADTVTAQQMAQDDQYLHACRILQQFHQKENLSFPRNSSSLLSHHTHNLLHKSTTHSSLLDLEREHSMQQETLLFRKLTVSNEGWAHTVERHSNPVSPSSRSYSTLPPRSGRTCTASRSNQSQ